MSATTPHGNLPIKCIRCDRSFDAYGKVRDVRLTSSGGIVIKKMAQCPFCKCNNDVPNSSTPPHADPKVP